MRGRAFERDRFDRVRVPREVSCGSCVAVEGSNGYNPGQMNADPKTPEVQKALDATRIWLERAVIGLNLCPFAKPVHLANRIRFVVSEARTPEALLADLAAELQFLNDTPAETYETTLLIHPHVLEDFLDFNAFLDDAEAVVETLGLVGELQVASFHPRYQFAGTEPDEIENHTNHSPYPTLHLLRESSIERAVAACPDPAEIYEENMRTLRRLGPDGWRRLWLDEPPR